MYVPPQSAKRFALPAMRSTLAILAHELLGGSELRFDIDRDAMYFDPSAPHSYQREGRSSCSVIVVVAPK